MNKFIDIEGIVIKRERSELREFKETDLDDFYEYAKIPGVGEMGGWSHHKNKQESKTILKSFIDNKNTFAIVFNNKVIGSLGLERYDENLLKEFENKLGCEIGFVLSKKYWANGYMTEAVKAMVKYLFTIENLDFIVAGYFQENGKSKRVQEKSGFSQFKKRSFLTSDGSCKNGWLCLITKNSYK